MSFKALFERSLGANPGRLHFAAHSHHLWPDASFDGHVQAWDDAARFADSKWTKVMDDVWPAAQGEVAGEIGSGQPHTIIFAANTHELLVRVFGALAREWPIRVLTSDGEFHSARRQFGRWQELGAALVEHVPVDPFDSFSTRFLDRAKSGQHDLIFVSQLMFGSGRILDRIDELARLGSAAGPWVVIDGYHSFMAIERPFAGCGDTAFYLGGGYKYAMAGEGCAFMHAPDGFGPRPSITGWFAEFDGLSSRENRVGYATDARRFLGATFDPSGLYRFVAVRRMLARNGLTTATISAHCERLQQQLLAHVGSTPLSDGELLNPPEGHAHARFLAFRSPQAQRWHGALLARHCITDVRGDVLRIGFGIYQDESDVDRLIELLRGVE